MRRYKYYGIDIEITRRCNKACIHCGRGEPQDVTITEEIIDSLISNAEDVALIHLFGGEPLIAIDKIDYLVQQINTTSWTMKYLELTTNGTITDKKIIDIYEAFCMAQTGRIATLRISNDPFHNPTEYEAAFAYYKPLVEQANIRLKESGYNSKIYLQYTLDKTTDVRENTKLVYVGRAKTLIDSGNHLERNFLTTGFPDPYSHRLKIIGDTVQCLIQICANGNVSFSEMLEWDTIDELSFGNIMESHLTDIINKHNENCVILCSETIKLKTAQYGKFYLDWKPCQKIAFQVQELLYQKIFDLRRKAKALFPNVPVSQIIEEIPLPIDYDAELKLYEDIYKGYEYYNEEIAHVLHEPKSAPQHNQRLGQFFVAVRWCLSDTKTRRRPLYLLGDENDIKFSTPFLKFWKLNEETDIHKDNSKNFRCDLQDNEQLYYGEFDDGKKPGWDESEFSTNIQQIMEKIIERQQCV